MNKNGEIKEMGKSKMLTVVLVRYCRQIILLLVILPTICMAGQVTLKWDEPSTNTDGSPLICCGINADDLTYYELWYGHESGNYAYHFDIIRPPSCGAFPSKGLCSYTGMFQSGVYFFAMKACNKAHNCSIFSNEVSKMVSTIPGPCNLRGE